MSDPHGRMGSKSPGNTSQPPAFFSKLTESNSAMVKSKKQEINKKLNTHNRNEPEYSKVLAWARPLCSLGWPQTRADPPASASGVLGSQACTAKPSMQVFREDSSFSRSTALAVSSPWVALRESLLMKGSRGDSRFFP